MNTCTATGRVTLVPIFYFIKNRSPVLPVSYTHLYSWDAVYGLLSDRVVGASCFGKFWPFGTGPGALSEGYGFFFWFVDVYKRQLHGNATLIFLFYLLMALR